MKRAFILMIVCVVSASSDARAGQSTTQGDRSAPGSRIFKLEQLAFPQIEAFDRQRTLFILPVGMIEQHGPHLPIGADTIGVTDEAIATATRVGRALPDWNVIVPCRAHAQHRHQRSLRLRQREISSDDAAPDGSVQRRCGHAIPRRGDPDQVLRG